MEHRLRMENRLLPIQIKRADNNWYVAYILLFDEFFFIWAHIFIFYISTVAHSSYSIIIHRINMFMVFSFLSRSKISIFWKTLLQKFYARWRFTSINYWEISKQCQNCAITQNLEISSTNITVKTRWLKSQSVLRYRSEKKNI